MSFLKKFCYSINCAFPTPKYLTFDPVGLDISNTAIRFMILEKSRFGLVPKKYDTIELKMKCDLASDSLKVDEVNEVISALTELRRKYKIKNVICSLPEQKTFIFKIKVPMVAISDVASSIRYQIEENVPLTAVDANFDYFICEPKDKQDYYDVVVSVFPKKIIETYTKILRKSGLEPISFQSESVAVAKSVVKTGDNNPYLLVRMMPYRTGVAIIENGIVEYASDIPVGGKEVISDISGEKANLLKEELNKLLIYWFTRKKDFSSDQKIETVILTGSDAKSPEIVDFLERYLKINVDVANVWSNCFSTDDYIPEMSEGESLDFAVAIGLAIKIIDYA